MVQTDYLNTALCKDNVREVISDMKSQIEKSGVVFDTIVVRGMSGMLVGPIMAYELKKSIVIVRKPTENSHSNCLVEGFLGIKKYIIIDDFIDSGATITEIVDNVKEFKKRAKLAGIFLYTAQFGCYSAGIRATYRDYKVPIYSIEEEGAFHEQG